MSRSRGLSLIEVVAAMAILGGSCVVLVHAQSQSLYHIYTARLRGQAASLAEELRTTWQVEDVDLSQDAQGEISQAPAWYWDRQVTRTYTSSLHELHYITLRLIHVTADDRMFEAHYHWLEAVDDAD